MTFDSPAQFGDIFKTFRELSHSGKTIRGTFLGCLFELGKSHALFIEPAKLSFNDTAGSKMKLFMIFSRITDETRDLKMKMMPSTAIIIPTLGELSHGAQSAE